MERASEAARRVGAKLEAAVTLPGAVEELGRWAPDVARWLVYQADEVVAGEAATRQVREAVGGSAWIAASTKGHFAELNRNRPAGEAWDGACFSATPQVHAVDDWSVMSNVAGQFEAVKSARRILRGKGVTVSPVTLRPVWNPAATGEYEPPEPDPRQKLQFCAAWTVGSLDALTAAGAESVTYFETCGPGGVLDGSTTYPVFQVLEALGAFAGGGALACESSDAGRVRGLVLAASGRRRALLANMTDAEQAVEFDGESMALAPYEVRQVDSTAPGGASGWI